MLIRDFYWLQIREQFSEDEKIALRKAVSNESVCPRGNFVDVARLSPALHNKLLTALRGLY